MTNTNSTNIGDTPFAEVSTDYYYIRYSFAWNVN